MALGRKKEDTEDTGGRYFVENVPVMMSGKKLLQLRQLKKGQLSVSRAVTTISQLAIKSIQTTLFFGETAT